MASPSASTTRTVPASLTSFVGRRNDIVAVRQLFSSTRLVTLTGLGGVGKTRLALQVAKELNRAFPDGVCLVELASLKDPDLLPHTVLDALGIRSRTTAGPLAVLRDYLQSRRLLLILDNCEHLVEAIADFVDEVLGGAPEVSVLATSRHAIRLRGEHLYPVFPLLVPDPNADLAPGDSLHYPSVSLFADRAASVVPGFRITPENEAAVVRLCHRLEGIPLALELASVRLRVLTVQELADRLDDRFKILREGNRTIPERHRTLQGLIDWSYDLCTDAEQLLWTRSSVFAGGFDLPGAEAVCTDDRLPRAAVLDTVAGLVDKSILVREEHGTHVRFRMMETISEYGRTRLAAAGEETALARRHRDWYAHLVKTAEREWAGPRQEEWALRLQQEYANLRHALEYCVSDPAEARTGLAMASVPWFWGAMDHMDEARLWLNRALALDPAPSLERAWALATTAYIGAFEGGDQTLANLPEQARDLAAELGDLGALAFANHVRGFFRSFGPAEKMGDALSIFAEALEQYAEAGVPAQYADSLRVEMATTYVLLGEFDRAAELVEELYERCTAAGERWNLSYARWLRGMLALVRGEHETAEAELFEALRIKRPFRDTLGLALTLEVLAWVAADRGEADRAATLSGATDSLWRTIGARLMPGARRRYERQGRMDLAAEKFQPARERGGRFTVEETLAFALREPQQQPERRANSAPSGLSRRELEVARLVAEGMSNREIAAKLVISLRTAEGHVEKILAKRGFKARTQIASWVLQQEVDGR
ncbi:LuxR C-terminal-related transcriptional regulator [Amycolatopsis sp. cg13]|uniref:LuxR C-terminal-related transcriptional regulator n=1 Tax=Amycolatopsis sp. cg13 TaxID=3238807 RepID=UPI0035239724